MRLVSLGLTLACTAALGACASSRNEASVDVTPDALAPSQVTTIGVNAYLWRAALDTLSFAPLVQADSSGGVVVTDWYANPASPAERVKVTAMILGSDLRADMLRVTASRQVNQGGQWVAAPVTAATVQKLEEIILTKARQLRQSASVG